MNLFGLLLNEKAGVRVHRLFSVRPAEAKTFRVAKGIAFFKVATADLVGLLRLEFQTHAVHNPMLNQRGALIGFVEALFDRVFSARRIADLIENVEVGALYVLRVTEELGLPHLHVLPFAVGRFDALKYRRFQCPADGRAVVEVHERARNPMDALGDDEIALQVIPGEGQQGGRGDEAIRRREAFFD